MAFEKLVSLDTDKVIGIDGKRDKKTGVKNPTSIEGYFLGTKKYESPKSKSGVGNIHVFQTPQGNIGVWGKTHLDGEMLKVAPGTMVKAYFEKMVPTKNGDMYKFGVEVDKNNTLDVSSLADQGQTYTHDDSAEDNDNVSYESAADNEDEVEYQEPVYTPAPAALASKTNAARAQALLSKNKLKN